MIRVVNTIRIKKGHTDEVLARFQTPKSVHTFDGFIIMEVLRNETKEAFDEIKVCTTWQSEEAFNVWMTSRDSKNAHGKSGEKPTNSPILGNEVAIYEIAVQHKPS